MARRLNPAEGEAGLPDCGKGIPDRGDGFSQGTAGRGEGRNAEDHLAKGKGRSSKARGVGRAQGFGLQALGWSCGRISSQVCCVRAGEKGTQNGAGAGAVRTSEPPRVQEGTVPTGDSQARRPRVHPGQALAALPTRRPPPPWQRLLGRWLPGAGGRGGPGSRPQPPAGRLPDAPERKRHVWASRREEVPCRVPGGSAKNGEGRAGAGRGRGARPGWRPLPPPRTSPTPPPPSRPGCGPGPGWAGGLHLPCSPPPLRPRSSLRRSPSRRGSGVRGPAWLGRPTETSWVPGSAAHSLRDPGESTVVSEPQIPGPRHLGMKCEDAL